MNERVDNMAGLSFAGWWVGWSVVALRLTYALIVVAGCFVAGSVEGWTTEPAEGATCLPLVLLTTYFPSDFIITTYTLLLLRPAPSIAVYQDVRSDYCCSVPSIRDGTRYPRCYHCGLGSETSSTGIRYVLGGSIAETDDPEPRVATVLGTVNGNVGS